MSKAMLKGVHRRALGITNDDEVMGAKGFFAGGDGAAGFRYPSPAFVAVFDDFISGRSVGGTDTGAAGLHFITRKGDTGTTGAIAAATNGVFRFTPTQTATTGTPAGTVFGIVNEQLMWKANMGAGNGAGNLRFGVRLKKATYSGGEHGIFVGFTDSNAAEMPVHDTGGTADKATATNAVGIGWNVSGDTGWMGYAVDGDTVQETALTTVAPTDNTYVDLELEVRRSPSDTGGQVFFWVDGVPQGSIDNPLNVSTALTAIVAGYDTGGASVVDIDWAGVSAPRDTGT